MDDAEAGVKVRVDSNEKSETIVMLPVFEFFKQVIEIASGEHEEMQLNLEEADYSTIVKYSKPFVFEIEMPQEAAEEI